MYRILSFNTARQLNYFTTCTTSDGLHYVATSQDKYIIKKMYIDRTNFAEDEMKLFKMLVKLFYGIDDSEGLFLDLGANIGTSGIYFTKVLSPGLKLLAFEPDPENFKLLRTNLVLNDMEENATAENYGLGIEESEMTIYRDAVNPGHNGLYSNDSGVAGETVRIIPLDKYFTEKNLSPKDVKYIWIDTEGFEPQVLIGMKNILTANPAPIFMEFNPRIWQQSGYFDKMMKFFNGLYENYVWVAKTIVTGQIEVYPIEKLLEFKNSQANFGTLGDIFLIHELKGVAE